MNDITFVIFTFNEEARIEKVIKNFIGFGKVLLADDGSTDKTHEIANAYGANVIIRAEKYEFTENQKMLEQIYANITTNWIYWGYADEMMDKVTLEHIKLKIESNKYDIINIDRKNYYYGRFCYNLHHARMNRIFKKGAIDFTDNKIHAFGKVTVSKKRVYKMPNKYFVHHFISNTASGYLNIINRYSETEIHRAPKTSILYLYMAFIKLAFFDFFYGGGKKAGFQGIALMETQLFYFLVKNMKHFEHAEELTTISIERKNDQIRNEISNQFVG